jgi:hypothetical protein
MIWQYLRMQLAVLLLLETAGSIQCVSLSLSLPLSLSPTPFLSLSSCLNSTKHMAWTSHTTHCLRTVHTDRFTAVFLLHTQIPQRVLVLFMARAIPTIALLTQSRTSASHRAIRIRIKYITTLSLSLQLSYTIDKTNFSLKS